MTKPRILCVGMATIDHVFRLPAIPREPTKVRATEYVRISGGMAANAAVAAARLGGQVEYWGPIGADANGDDILAELAAEGVRTSGVIRVPQRAAVSAIMVDEAGERLVCGYSDPSTFDAEAVLPLERLSEFDAVHADCRWWKAARQVLPAARRLGIPTVFDGDITSAAVLAEVAPLAQYPIFSERGLLIAAPDASHDDRLASVARRSGGFAGVTLGARGFLWYDGGEIHTIGVPEVKVVDTLGAGDVFHGAFAYALALRMDTAAAARFASATAALKCTRFGGRGGTPTHAEVDDLLGRWRA
jgi:sulfofructose kinase